MPIIPNRRGVLLAAAGLLAGLARPARAADLLADLTAGTKKLRVGTDATFPPFEQTAPDGGKSGFDIDLVNAIAKRAGIGGVEFQQVPFGQLVPGLLADHIDLAASSIYITPERAKVVDFSAAYFTGGLSVMLKPDDTSVTKPADLAGKTVAVQVGTKSVNFLQQNFPGVTLHIAQTNDQMFQALQSQQADAVVTGLPAAQFYIKVHGGAKLAPFTLTHEQYGLALRKTDTTLLAAVNTALAAMEADGSLAALKTKWFG
jgi:ABC-type amino acid transport substrate-binding protein